MSHNVDRASKRLTQMVLSASVSMRQYITEPAQHRLSGQDILFQYVHTEFPETFTIIQFKLHTSTHFPQLMPRCGNLKVESGNKINGNIKRTH